MTNPISLADVIALRVSPHWAEAVAVVEELCAVLPADAAGRVAVPDLADIVITAQGTVMVHKGARGIRDIDELGRILHALLPPGETPMPLRLFATHSIGSGKYATVVAYAEALAYYARPGRSELIRSLYERCLTAPLIQAPVPVADEPEEEQPPVENRRSRRWVAVLAALALLCAAGAAAFVMWGRDERVTSSLAAVREAVKSAADAVREQLGGSPEPEAPSTAQTGATPRTRRPESEAPVIELVPREYQVDGSLVPTVAPPGGSAIVDGGLAIPPTVSPSSLPAVVDTTVYTSGSQGVRPPELVSPKLPPVPLVETGTSGTNTLELLIDESGLVERVQLIEGPLRLPDMSLLSAAKAWKFHPAVKDGKPVRYRLTMSWVVSPR